jgi:metal-responsive CopG/Arc/MetJ family transcriptional regulator
MRVIRTAISIQKSLVDQVDILAHQLNVSRSHLFVLAVEDFIHRYQNQSLLNEINRAYADEPDPSEQARLNKMRKPHSNIVRGEW